MNKRFFRYFTYFRRGNGVYLALILSLANTITIQWRLTIQYIPFFQHIFKRMMYFAGVFTPCYILLSILIGWIDYKREGSVSTDQVLLAEANPLTQDTIYASYLSNEAFYLFLTGNISEAKQKNREANQLWLRWIQKETGKS